MASCYFTFKNTVTVYKLKKCGLMACYQFKCHTHCKIPCVLIGGSLDVQRQQKELISGQRSAKQSTDITLPFQMKMCFF